MTRRTPSTSEAWTWRHAFAGADLHATTKLLLHTVGMFMNEMGKGCFPSQAEIIQYSSLDKKTVIKHTRLAIDAGWLEAFQHGYRGQKWRRLEYKPCWPERDLAAEDAEPDLTEGGGEFPPPSEAEKAVESGGEGGGIEGSKVVEEVHQDKTFQNFPDSFPIEREARADADGQEGEPGEGEAARRDDPKKFEARVKRLAEGWPGWANSSTAWAVRQFAALTDAERAEAERCRAGYLAHCGGKALSVGTYLAEKKWLDLPAQALAAADPAARPQMAAPFGKLWGAKRMALLVGAAPQPAPPATGFLATQLADPGEAGRRARLERQARYGWPGVNRMDEMAAQAKPWPLAAFEAARLERLAEATEQVWTGTPLWDAWRDEFARRGWPWLPEMGRQRVASFPAGGPDGLEAFERAVRAGDGARGGEAGGRTGKQDRGGEARKAG